MGVDNRGRTNKLGGAWGRGEAKQLLHNKAHMGIMITDKGKKKTRDWTNNSSHYGVANVSRHENVNEIISNR